MVPTNKPWKLFLRGKIGFLDIETSIQKALEHVEYIQDPDYEQLAQSDYKAREFVKNYWS